MNKNVGLFLTHPLWEKQFFTVLELAEQHVKDGDNVTIYSCKKNMKLCEMILADAILCNKSYKQVRKTMCTTCKNCRKKGYDLIGVQFNKKSLICNKFYDTNKLIANSYFESHDKFQTLQVGNYDMGWAIISSLIHITRDPFINLIKYKKEIQQLCDTSVAVYYSALYHIDKDKLDIAYLQNGRLSYTKAIYRACEAKEIDFYTIESGSSLNKYGVFHQMSLHNIAKTTDLIFDYWNSNKNKEEKERIGHSFYIDRYNGGSEAVRSFVADQERNLLPKEWNDEDYNVVIFTSSEDEFVSISPEWNNPLYKTQIEGIKQIAEEFYHRNDNCKLYIRVHPNSEEMIDSYKQLLYQIAGSNVVVIPANSKISTYLLMDKADKVVTFGSTMGIEATYWGKPSILLSKSEYYYFECCHKPQNHKEAMEMIFDKTLQPITNINILKFGYFFKSFGVPYKYYKGIDFEKGLFKGISLSDYSLNWHNWRWWKKKLKKIIKK